LVEGGVVEKFELKFEGEFRYRSSPRDEGAVVSPRLKEKVEEGGTLSCRVEEAGERGERRDEGICGVGGNAKSAKVQGENFDGELDEMH